MGTWNFTSMLLFRFFHCSCNTLSVSRKLCLIDRRVYNRTARGRAHTSAKLNSLRFVSHRQISIKFCHNSSTTELLVYRFYSMLLIVLAPSLNDDESLENSKTKNADLHQNRINSSLSQTQPVHQVSSEYVHNFLRYRDMYHFCPSLSTVKNYCSQADIQTDRGENTSTFYIFNWANG